MAANEQIDFFMDEAIKLAGQGMTRGDGGPFGAVIVRNGEIIGRGWNRVLRTNDPTAHAEIVAIRDACARLASYWLVDCEIYVNCEPCPMCLAAIYWARLRAVHYAAGRADAAAIGFADEHIYEDIGRPLAERSLEIHGGRKRGQAVAIMRQWLALESKKPY